MKPNALRGLFIAISIPFTNVAAPMVFPGQDWAEESPSSQGIDPAKLEDAIAYLKDHTGKDGVQELAIVRNGRLVWKGPNIDKQHGVWSLTKSFTSTVLGLLIDDGKVTLDTLAKDHLPGLAETYPGVALRHFASMTSGYYAQGDEPRGSYSHGPSATPFVPGKKPLFVPPGSHYAYWDSAMNQFAHVLTRIAGEPIEELFKRRIGDPIGMNRERWNWGHFEFDGITVNGGAGNNNRHVFVSARELARFGLLFLNQGNWNGTQLISRDWVAAATSVQVPRDLPLGHAESSIDGRGVYGFNWWVNGIQADGRRKWPGAPAGTFAGAGFNNNRCFVIPEWDMVVVRLGLDGNVPDAVWNEFLTRLGGAVQTQFAGIRDLIFTCDFEAENWHREWGLSKPDVRTETVLEDADRRFEPLNGKALRIRVDEGGHYGASLQFRFRQRTGEEPEEVYFRYYLRFANDWNPRRGGKLPGIAGTYGRAGWGGRPVQGDDGWSARGLFQGQENGLTPIGFYCYHMDMRGRYGNNWVWDKDRLGYLENNRWYCIEQYARLNTPGQNNGILRAWVDGNLAFEKTDLRMRNTGEIRIETIWLNLYLGGTWTAESDHHLYIDEVAVSRSYIGPLVRPPASPVE
jgi:CubicO group peptidase (beta-lactamase class C family)